MFSQANPLRVPGYPRARGPGSWRALIDATRGRRTRAVVVTDSGHVLLVPVQPETVARRLAGTDEIETPRS